MKHVTRIGALALAGGLWASGIARAAETPVSPFAIRGALPWHNFLSGPTAWNEEDYERYLNELQRQGLNSVVFHCYTGGAERYAPYVEPMLRLEYRQVVPEAALDTSLTARWGYRPLAISEFAFGTGRVFPQEEGTGAFGARCAVRARDKEDRYRGCQDLMRRVIAMAHVRGIQVGMGFEFGIHPPEFASIVPPESGIRGAMLPDPTHPASIEILRQTIDGLVGAYPDIDWVWLWLHEHTMFVGKPQPGAAFAERMRRDAAFFQDAPDEGIGFSGTWSLEYIRLAREYLARRAPQVRVAISGWGGGNQLPHLLRGLDRALPKDIVFTCLNPDQGMSPQPAVMAEIAQHRQVWAIPWLEGDAQLWHPQPRVALLGEQVRLAREQRLNGVVAIHWRTAETRVNLAAFAAAARDPDHIASTADFYRQDAIEQYGVAVAEAVALILARWDGRLGFQTDSPEYFPYHPGWGRLKPEVRGQLTNDVAELGRLAARIDAPNHRSNLDWLLANFEFTLLLDEVGRRIEPAYRLRHEWLAGKTDPAGLPGQMAEARQSLQAAPMEKLFHTFARRVRSRGELGELSSLNQRLGLQYRELERFLNEPLTGR